MCLNQLINMNSKIKCDNACSKSTCYFTNDNKDNYFDDLERYNENYNANCQNMNN